jgi:hypothetical protein
LKFLQAEHLIGNTADVQNTPDHRYQTALSLYVQLIEQQVDWSQVKLEASIQSAHARLMDLESSPPSLSPRQRREAIGKRNEIVF